MKPADVSQEAWDQAETYKQLWARGPGTIKETLARAITAAVAAEREACAVVAEHLNGWGADCGMGGHALHIAKQIRARSTP